MLNNFLTLIWYRVMFTSSVISVYPRIDPDLKVRTESTDHFKWRHQPFGFLVHYLSLWERHPDRFQLDVLCESALIASYVILPFKFTN